LNRDSKKRKVRAHQTNKDKSYLLFGFPMFIAFSSLKHPEHLPDTQLKNLSAEIAFE